MTSGVVGDGVVVALGGGGVRGVAHLGVLDALTEAGLTVRGLAGTSSGAWMGALWLTEPTLAMEKVREFVTVGGLARLPDMRGLSRDTGWLRRWAKRAQTVWGLGRVLVHRQRMSAAAFLEAVGFLVPEIAIEDLPIPFVAVAVDSATGAQVFLDRGPLRVAVAASSAMPGLAPPVHWEGRRLQDGGAVAEIPVQAARRLGSPVLAVEVSEALPASDPDRNRVHRAMFRAAAMGWQALRERMLAEADHVLAPEVNHLHWAEFESVDTAYQAGRAAAWAWVNSQGRCGS